MEKTTKYLRCHTAGTKRDITEGKRYEIVDTAAFLGNECYVIIDDAGDRSAWPIEIDEDGESYRDWFTLETDADSAPTTLRPDESLGGVLREYREVKRKACVGELVKIVDAGCSFGHYDDGDVITITEVIAGDPYFPVKKNADNPDGTFFLNDEEYVVLEPTEILVINTSKGDGGAERFRMVDRKAAVGERVIIIKTDDLNGDGYGNGALFTADVDDGSMCIDTTDGVTLFHEEYRVLEPLTSVELAPTPTPLSELPLADQYAENITVLTRKIAQLEKRNTALEGRILALETDSAPAIVPSYAKVASGPVDNTYPSYVKTPQMIRDEIVERAKADVSNPYKFSGTEIPGDPDGISFWPEGSPSKMHEVTYVVNREKRTVVALIRCINDGFTVRGTAKCAPGETFNAHIGRAIALYRALGLDVPAEYLTCPQPEEVRIGDVVAGGVVYAVRPTHRTVGVSVPQAFTGVELGYTYIDKYGLEMWAHIHHATITDDSREDGGVSAASSALKGAA
ncbi:hypothetical protein [Paenibacillus sp. B-A-8]|uniref:hypothetical protein n=1 Tax=Paenibacillus sp. B-A-8 TaxID=3400419 RepID=UPI003B0153A0